MVEWDEELDTKVKEHEKKTEKPKPEVGKVEAKTSAVFTEDDIKGLLDGALKRQLSEHEVAGFNCLILGADGTGKSGIVLSYLAKKPKKSVIIDLDRGVEPVYEAYHRGNDKLIIVPVLEMTRTEDDIILDYRKTLVKLKGIIKYVAKHHDEFSGICIDGISSLLKNAEYIMRIDKHIAPDGGVSMRYWIQRNKIFTEILEAVKNIKNIDRFYIGHEDFVMKEDAAAVKAKTNQMIHQRIMCKKVEDKNVVKFVAKIDKCKYNLSLEGTEYTFGTVNKETKETTWRATQVFKGLRGEGSAVPEKK